MKRFLPLLMLLIAVIISSCKSTTPVATTPDTHGIDASGNVWMQAPPAGEGVQIAVQPFDVPANTEVQGDFYLTLPSDLPFDVGRVEIAMNQGTHHMNMYKSSVNWPADSGVPRPIVYTGLDGKADTTNIRYQAEFNANIVRTDGSLLVEAQIPYLNWVLPKVPTGEQSVIHFSGHDTLIIENHFVNVGSQLTPNGKGKVIINLWKATAGPTTTASIMFARNHLVQVLPHSSPSFSKNCYFGYGNAAFQYPIYVLGMTGHFHSRGKTFTVDKMRRNFDVNGKAIGDTAITPGIYQSVAWDEPPFITYDTPIKLDLVTNSNGSGYLEYLRYTATYVNNTDQTFNFGPHVATDEHCNLFVWFSPSYLNGRTLYDDSNN